MLQGKKNKKEAEVDRGMGQPESKSLVWLPIVSILMIMAIFLSGLFAPKGWNWALVMFFMVVFIFADRLEVKPAGETNELRFAAKR